MSRRRPFRLTISLTLCAMLNIASVSCVSLDSIPHDDHIGPAAAGASAEVAAETKGPASESQRVTVSPEGPLTLTVRDSILLALQNNRSLEVERYNPPIQRTYEEQERAVFDPVLGAELSWERVRTERLARAGAETESAKTQGTGLQAGVETLFPTGTTVSVEGRSALTESSLYADDFGTSRVGLTVTQALLRGFGLEPNLAGIRQARLDTRASEYELRGFAESLVADLEHTYWDYALAQQQIKIVSESLRLAEKQRDETVERIKIGRLAEIELAAAEAEVALRREALINARSALETTRLALLRLLNPPGANLWGRPITLRDTPAVPDLELDDVEEHAAVAQRMRPDLNQARLAVQRGELEIVKTRNGLLPKLDLFITLGKTGYSNSFQDSIHELDGKTYGLSAGLTLEYPLGNRDPRASHARAVLERTQATVAVDNLGQLVEVDVRSAYIEATRTKEQVDATRATRRFQEETLRAETEKFRVGRSTSLLVAQAQRDLMASQLAEIEAVVNYLKALIELYRLEGSLLERRGLEAPGREPVSSGVGRRP